MKDLKASEKDKKRQEELDAPKILSTHEFFIPEELGCSVELDRLKSNGTARLLSSIDLLSEAGASVPARVKGNRR